MLDVVVREGAAIFQLLAFKDEALLVWWDSGLFELDFCLYVFDCFSILNIEGDRFAKECLHKDLHSTASAAIEDIPHCNAT